MLGRVLERFVELNAHALCELRKAGRPVVEVILELVRPPLVDEARRPPHRSTPHCFLAAEVVYQLFRPPTARGTGEVRLLRPVIRNRIEAPLTLLETTSQCRT